MGGLDQYLLPRHTSSFELQSQPWSEMTTAERLASEATVRQRTSMQQSLALTTDALTDRSESIQVTGRSLMRPHLVRRRPQSGRALADVFRRWLLRLSWFFHSRDSARCGTRRIFFPGYHLAAFLGNDDHSPGIENHKRAVEQSCKTWRLDMLPHNMEDNSVCNQRYSLLTFFPLTLASQMRYFFNVFYLLVGVSQIAPQFQIGPLFTYLAPLCFVITMSLTKEAVDDIKRNRRDRAANTQRFEVMAPFGDSARDILRSESQDGLMMSELPASELKAGHVVRLHGGQRVPCDMLLLKTLSNNRDGTTFVRTDQLDGETDWKLRRAIGLTQRTPLERLFDLNAEIEIEAPRKEIYEFCGSITARVDRFQETPSHLVREPLGLEHTLWTNSVVTAGPVLGLAIFAGKETRAAMHTSTPGTKMGKFDLEINRMSKFLCAVLVAFAIILTLAKPIGPLSLIYLIRFILLLSSIIPISLRVNLDMAKIVYSYFISTDKEIAGTIVRNSLLPEELGRIDVIFSDKTGTITKNKMSLQRIVTAGKCYAVVPGRHLQILQNEIPTLLEFARTEGQMPALFGCLRSSHARPKPAAVPRLRNLIAAMALCHSVGVSFSEDEMCYQASSPDEMALVTFAANSLRLTLVHRLDHSMELEYRSQANDLVTKFKYEILETFPFSSARKRMGILLREVASRRLLYLLKGADVAITPRLSNTPQWYLEELEALSRSGLRTLVFAAAELTQESLDDFQRHYADAKVALVDREARCNNLIERMLEKNMELLGISGVEDELQTDVASTVETLCQAGIKMWMLTGDKTETALCIATSAGLKGRHDVLVTLTREDLHSPSGIAYALQRPSQTRHGDFGMRSRGARETVVACLDGEVLGLILMDPELSRAFVSAVQECRSVVCCRCSPTQKSQVVQIVKKNIPTLRLAAVGDGGNDVAMIQAAHCGIGIVGLEGQQASLASDFSILEFRSLKKLLLWHGRLAHQRSAKLSSFVIHRGLVISVIQIIFSSMFYFTPLALFQGWLQVGYATYYTMLPVFALVLDRDLPQSVAYLFPELYASQKFEGSLNDRTFLKILFKSIYQGAAIMLGVLAFFERQLMNLVAVAFTSLILAELLNVVSEIMTWHPVMIAAEILTVIIYATSLIFLPEYFDLNFISTSEFWSKVAIITLLSWLPVHSYKALRKCLSPPQYAKLGST